MQFDTDFFLVPKSGTVRALLYSVKETGFLVPVFGTGYCVMGLSGYFTISNGIFKFNFLALVVSEISGSPKFTRGSHAPPMTLPIKKKIVPEATT